MRYKACVDQHTSFPPPLSQDPAPTYGTTGDGCIGRRPRTAADHTNVGGRFVDESAPAEVCGNGFDGWGVPSREHVK